MPSPKNRFSEENEYFNAFIQLILFYIRTAKKNTTEKQKNLLFFPGKLNHIVLAHRITS